MDLPTPFEHVGGLWTPLIMRDALDGIWARTKRNLGIAPTMLTSRLRTSGEADLVALNTARVRLATNTSPPKRSGSRLGKEHPRTNAWRKLFATAWIQYPVAHS
ncbi:hypothetical protein AB0B25_00735 [Nocardia sp. NPDC049190]|uniref:hypothetical protein n=1 Tax=Nocardia sp. NPDC049190 TaxID=3155650 RepID=UPI0033D527CD